MIAIRQTGTVIVWYDAAVIAPCASLWVAYEKTCVSCLGPRKKRRHEAQQYDPITPQWDTQEPLKYWETSNQKWIIERRNFQCPE